jgi:hypothetical protein
MKKLATIFGAFMITSVVLTSCGGELESDLMKFCELQCDSQNPELQKTVEEGKAVGKKFHTFRMEMEAKYADDRDARMQLNAASQNCDCK